MAAVTTTTSAVAMGSTPLQRQHRIRQATVRVVSQAVAEGYMQPQTRPEAFSEEKLQRIADIFFQDIPRPTVLTEEACFHAILRSVDRGEDDLIDRNVELVQNILDSSGHTLYQVACVNGLVHAVDVFRREGCLEALYPGVDHTDGFVLAAAGGDLQLVQHFLRTDKQVGVNQQLSEGHIARRRTALHAAIDGAHVDVVKFLLRQGAKLNIEVEIEVEGKNYTFRPVAYAVARGRTECLAAILEERNLDLDNHFVPDLGNLLHIAICFDQNRMLSYLLSGDCRELTQGMLKQHVGGGKCGPAPLSYAAERGNIYATVLLIRARADLTEVDAAGNTCVHYAARAGQSRILEILASAGCNLESSNNAGERPRDVAPQRAERSTVDIPDLISSLSDQQRRIGARLDRVLLTQIDTLVWKGGGPKGVAYGGVLRALEDWHLLEQIRHMAGSSAGAITACLGSMGYDSCKLEELLCKLNLKDLLDHPLTKTRIKKAIRANTTLSKLYKAAKAAAAAAKNPVGVLTNLVSKLNPLQFTGVCSGEVFRDLMEELISEATGIPECTFGELAKLADSHPEKFKHLTVFTTAITTPRGIKRLSTMDPQCHEYVIADAIRCSMAIPYAFVPHYLQRKIDGVLRREDGLYVDGGVLFNLPVEAFPANSTMGFELVDPVNNDPVQAGTNIGLIGLSKGMLELWMSSEEMHRQASLPSGHTIVPICNEGVGLLEFDLSDDKQQLLLDSGYNGTTQYLEDFAVNSLGADLPYSLREYKEVGLPPANPHFQPRTTAYREIEEYCTGTPMTRLDPSRRCHLYGEQNVGKKGLVSSFANLNKNKFSLVIWVDGNRERESLIECLTQIFGVEITPGAILRDIRTRLAEELSRYSHPKPWLVICSSIEECGWLPRKGGCVLATSREPSEDDTVHNIQVTDFNPYEKRKALRGVRENAPDELVSSVAKQLESKPLAVATAAAYLQCYPEITLEEFSAQLPSDNVSALPYIVNAALDKIESSNTEVAELLPVCQYFDSNTISVDWLTSWMKEARALVAPKFVRQTLLKAVEILLDHNLISWEQENEVFSIHPDILAILQQRYGHQQRVAAFEFLANNERTRHFQEDKPNTWSYGFMWLRHAEALLSTYAPAELAEMNPKTLARFYRQMGAIYVKTQSFGLSTEYLQNALKLFDNQGNVKEQIHVLTLLAEAEDAQRNWGEAVKIYGQALTLCAQAKKKINPCTTAKLYVQLGISYYRLKNLDLALEQLNEANRLYSRQDVNAPIQHARALLYLGIVQASKTRTKKALGYLNQANTLVLQVEHGHGLLRAQVLVQMGKIQQQENQTHALSCFGEAQSIVTSLMTAGTDLLLAEILVSLGNIHMRSGEYNLASQHYQRAVLLSETHYEEEACPQELMETHQRLGHSLLLENRCDEARQALAYVLGANRAQETREVQLAVAFDLFCQALIYESDELTQHAQNTVNQAFAILKNCLSKTEYEAFRKEIKALLSSVNNNVFGGYQPRTPVGRFFKKVFKF